MPEDKFEDERNALQTFERILEIMPDDRGALEAAIMAAQACEESEIALRHRLHLAEILAAEGDAEALLEHVDALRASPDPRAVAWVESFESGLSFRPASAASASAAASPVSVRMDFNIADEIDLAWKLYDHREINQEEYAGLVKDLTEMSASHNSGTVSVLHALEAGHHKSQDRILSFLAQEAEETGTPYVSLNCFAMRSELLGILPDAFMVNRGAIVFELLGKERLVAVLNPFNLALRADVQQLCGHPCHFYLSRASEFDAALSRLRQVAESAGA